MHTPQKVRYSHEALADMILANPTMTQIELAAVFGRSPAWVSYLIASEAFQLQLSKRRDELVNPLITASVEDRLKGLASRSIDLLMEKLNEEPKVDPITGETTGGPNAALALKTLEIGAKALGYGARESGPQVTANFVVQMPGKAPSSGEWESAYAGGKLEAKEAPPA